MLPAVRSAFAKYGVTDVRKTDGRADEGALASSAIADGATTIICVGGDGTSGNVANAILQSGAAVRLGVIPAGTGNDFAKTLGVTSTPVHEIARLAVESSDHRMDVGRVDGRFFLNSCGFGFDVAVVQGLARQRWLKGNGVYIYTALRQLLGFRGLNIAIRSLAADHERSLYLMLVVANAPHFGGTFIIAPAADVTDGELDAVLVLNASSMRRLRLLGAATRGAHTAYREVRVNRAAEFTLAFDQPQLYETDGEIHQAERATLEVRCIPAALRVISRATLPRGLP
ncbi:MAG: YegS/Rv2252/BmrU family lipid kinase [Gemmatimonadota bacterium]|nr:YegS/Rv2252/BmrU family lipid kinase [Gemmatimonadota bacterium]